ncbi:MAG: NUDIX hydrolase [Thermoanaerobaculia bacterium]
MRLPESIVASARDGARHEYCFGCLREGALHEEVRDGRRCHVCGSCGAAIARRLLIDPDVVWWMAEDGRYWHESAGVVVQNEAGEILLFTRALFPPGFTVPAGHVDRGEEPARTAAREVNEEVGLRVSGLELLDEADVEADCCRRGCDHHRWHLYRARVIGRPAVIVNEEGVDARWVTLAEALALPLTHSTRFFLERMATSRLSS